MNRKMFYNRKTQRITFETRVSTNCSFLLGPQITKRGDHKIVIYIHTNKYAHWK